MREIAQWTQLEHQFSHWFDEKKEIERMCITLTFHFGCVSVCMCVLKSSLCSSFYFVDACYCLRAFLLLLFFMQFISGKKKSTLSFELIIFKASSFIRWTAKKKAASSIGILFFLACASPTYWWMAWTSWFLRFSCNRNS